MAELLNQIIPDVVARSDQLWRAFWETIQMVGISGAISVVLRSEERRVGERV